MRRAERDEQPGGASASSPDGDGSGAQPQGGPVSDVLEAADESAAVEQLHELGCTDGLPVIVPTAARVERHGAGQRAGAGTWCWGRWARCRAATVEKVAIAAVMAGCTADHIPVVVAAVQAVMRPRLRPHRDAGHDPLHRAAAGSSTGRPATPAARSPPASAPSVPATGPTPRSAERCGSA